MSDEEKHSPGDDVSRRCSFCGRPADQVEMLVAGPQGT
ncbi:MAG: ClpX C4-type zinc finger protein, partial [Candidatus Marinimicrobia bacterium]|nr:ClpX C4-type zinc finger protein [Candidatus Neomarinimicrobiota bacterium]